MFIKKYEQWLNNINLDEDLLAELLPIEGNFDAIEERFHKDLEFGTAGLRGLMGAGTNRINVHTVRRVSQGLAQYILAQGGAGRGVVIAYDSRRFSRDFAFETAFVMKKNNIKTFIFEELRPTPQLSFAVRHLGCIAGVMITASHNPPEYNGYKVYWEDGAQLSHPQDEEVIKLINTIDDFVQVEKVDLSFVSSYLDDKYLAKVATLSLNGEVIKNNAKNFKIVYTPLSGAGTMPVFRALLAAGFENVKIVASQASPDPNFAGLKYPNPEDAAAFEEAWKLADEIDADIAIATDPDADRMGASIRNENGQFQLLSGNATGIILTEYILSQMSKHGKLPKNGGIISTIVSSRLTSEIAAFYGVAYEDTLTGFKNIAKKIRESNFEYIFGFEESYGYMAGNFVRDKDAISACFLICEAAIYYKSKGKNLFEVLEDIYKKFGYFKELSKSIDLSGLDGAKKIKEIIQNFKEKPPQNATLSFEWSGDDMLYFNLPDDAWFCVRPSGTEPKIKFYLGVKGNTAADADAKLAELKNLIFENLEGA